MTFYYHMYGSTMSCVIIYIKIQATNRLKPVWLKSQDRGDRWIPGKISINETGNYQVSYNEIIGCIGFIRVIHGATKMQY